MTVQIKDALIWEKTPNWYTARRATSLKMIWTRIKKYINEQDIRKQTGYK